MEIIYWNWFVMWSKFNLFWFASTFTISATPTMKRYIQNRGSFLKLGTLDVSTPRRARVNLEFGKETVQKYQKRVATLQQTVCRLRTKLQTMEDTIAHLKEEGHICATTANILTVGVQKWKFCFLKFSALNRQVLINVLLLKFFFLRNWFLFKIFICYTYFYQNY